MPTHWVWAELKLKVFPSVTGFYSPRGWNSLNELFSPLCRGHPCTLSPLCWAEWIKWKSWLNNHYPQGDGHAEGDAFTNSKSRKLWKQWGGIVSGCELQHPQGQGCNGSEPHWLGHSKVLRGALLMPENLVLGTGIDNAESML